MVYTIEEIKEKAAPLAKDFGVKSVGVFGSYARGEAKENSDIDLCIEKGKLRTLFEYFDFVDALENAFGCHIDVVTTEIKDNDFLNEVLKERILICSF